MGWSCLVEIEFHWVGLLPTSLAFPLICWFCYCWWDLLKFYRNLKIHLTIGNLRSLSLLEILKNLRTWIDSLPGKSCERFMITLINVIMSENFWFLWRTLEVTALDCLFHFPDGGRANICTAGYLTVYIPVTPGHYRSLPVTPGHSRHFGHFRHLYWNNNSSMNEVTKV